MREVQDALASIGIPVYALILRAETPPEQYIVYTSLTTEDEHWDDAPVRYKVYAYLNLWSKGDPTQTVLAVRNAMRSAGFSMVEETDSYEDDTGMYLVSSTWVFWKGVEANGA